MKVIRVAETKLTAGDPMLQYMRYDEDSYDPDLLVEFAGRGCYESWGKPNVATRANIDYVQSIIDKDHYSVLEHASVTYRVEGVSRNMLLELERHRMLSMSIISTRFVDASKLRVIVPPALRDDIGTDTLPLSDEDFATYRGYVNELTSRGYTRKQAREAAVWVLPGNLETRGVITGNLRTWREIISKRYTPEANAEIREFAGLVLLDLKEYAPHVMDDM